jgi:hypothetical protein
MTATGPRDGLVSTVPGEGVEPSRAEAHGFLRPARLPIPPSRPSGSRVAARGRRACVAALLLLMAAACTDDVSRPEGNGHTIAYLLDGAPADAELVSSPALAGLELAARESANIEIEPMDVGVDRDEAMVSLRALAEDRGVVAAVIAPWTAPPAGAIELLAAEGLPVVTFSWAWGPPGEGAGLWHSFVPERAREAVMLLSGAFVPEGAPLCLAGDDHVTSRALLATTEELGEAAGDPELLIGGIAETGRAATAAAVAARIRDARCPSLVWIGGAMEAASILSSIDDPPSVVATSRMKTDEGLEVASTGVGLHTICACVDVSLSTEPRSQRFVHDLQAESGAPPGPFSVEAYDAGTLLMSLVQEGEGTRGELAKALGDLTRFRGLGGTYAFEPDGSRARSAVGVWRAMGSRWLPEPRRPPLRHDCVALRERSCL